MYTAALALWPLLLVWWPWLVAGLVAVVALGARWLWWRLPERQAKTNEAAATGEPDVPPIFHALRHRLAGRGCGDHDRLRLTIRDPKARTDVEDNFRKIGQLLLAAAALVGAGLAYLPFQQQQRSSHDVLISNQVAKGFELLGNKDKEPMQRLGGIYALEGVMNNSEDYHQPVLEALSAFVRVETKTETGEGPPPDDIQAALSVITRRKSGFKELPLFLGKVHIPKADLGGTNLTRAYLNGANLTRAHLVGADLTRAYLNDTNLTSANLTRAHLAGADLSGADLSGADLSGAFLTVADLNDTNLTSANLTSADLAGADLSGAILTSADLTRADLGGTKLTRAHLTRAHLTRAHLVGADLTGAYLNDTNLTSANLTSADLTDVQYLTQEQLDKACGTGVRGLDKLDPPLTIKPC